MSSVGTPSARYVGTVQRAVAVLDTLADATTDLGTNEIARRSGVNPSSASRLLATLAAEGLVDRAGDTGRWRLGLRLAQLGTAALARLDLREVARPHLVALVDATGETATLSVPGGREAMTVDFVQSAASVQSVARIGRPSVAHATATGKVLLAYGGAEVDEPPGDLEAFTERTITARDALAAEVARTAERGWGQAVGEREIDLNAIAAPVFDDRGTLVAMLGLQGPAGRFDAQAMRAATEPLCASAARISATWHRRREGS
ncbi:MAG: IclR family transcriptional regulator [Egibacteraceae bacterium]